MTVSVRVSTRADRDAKKADDWWRRHRAATELFKVELADALEAIASSPEVRPVWRVRRGRKLRRVLMPLTRYHVYYSVDASREVTVHRIWSARRGRSPFG